MCTWGPVHVCVLLVWVVYVFQLACAFQWMLADLQCCVVVVISGRISQGHVGLGLVVLHLPYSVFPMSCIEIALGTRNLRMHIQYPSDTRYKAFHKRAHSHEKRNLCTVGVKCVHATNKTRFLLVWSVFSRMSKCVCSACETCFTRVSLVCETHLPCM